MKLGIVLVGALLAVAGVGCSVSDDGASRGPTQSASPTPHPRGFDPVMRDIAVEVPGFAGLSDDANTNTLQVRVTREVPDIDKLKSAIEARFPDLSGRKIEFFDVAHELGHLTEWYSEIGALSSKPGLVNQIAYTGFDNSGNVIEIGVLTEEARRAAYRQIAKLGIPSEYVEVVISGPVVLD